MKWFLALIRSLTQAHGERVLFNGQPAQRRQFSVNNRAARRAARSAKRRMR